MKKILAFVLALCMILALCACGQSTVTTDTASATPTPEVTVEPTTTTVVTTLAPTVTPAPTATPTPAPTSTLEIVYVTSAPTNNITIVPAPSEKQTQTVPSATAYAGIIDNYRTALTNGWDPQTCIDNGVNYLVPTYAQNYPSSLGYCFKDVDGNGIEELLIGSDNLILSMYSLSGSTPVQVLDGGERSSYYLEPDGVIVNSGSSSAYYHSYDLYKLVGTVLTLSGSIIANYEANADAPYYYASDEDGDVSNDKKVSNETAEGWINAYESNYVTLPYISFV